VSDDLVCRSQSPVKVRAKRHDDHAYPHASSLVWRDCVS
jgi:hypothetical protein